jgi:sulfonate transport system substrate-binding protein
MQSDHPSRPARRRTLGLLAAAIASGSAGLPGRALAQTPSTIRIGYQKYGTLTLLKGRGTLEQRLAAQKIAVKWTEFPAGPVLLEGLNVGSIDFGTVGEAPPIFAQAAGARLVYVGHEPASPGSEAIVVPKSSPLRSLADLRGKKIVLNKGSNVHFLLVRALEKAGIPWGAIQPIYLPPAEARAAFERGSVDAWVIWDPFLAAAEQQLGARVGQHARSFVEQQPALTRILLEEIGKVDEWGRANPVEVAQILSVQTGLPRNVVELAGRRYSYGVKKISPEVVREQQRIADAFHNLKLIPKPIAVAEALPPATL